MTMGWFSSTCAIRPAGCFTDRLFGTLEPPVKERDILRIEAPLGTFFLREDSSRPIVLLGAAAPALLRSRRSSSTHFINAINRADEAKASARDPSVLGRRSAEDLYLAQLPEAWAREQPDFHYVPVLSEPKPEDEWRGRTGFVHRAVIDDLPDLSAFQVYACGAPAMIDAAKRDFVGQCGLPVDEFFSDAFTTQADLVNA